MGIRRRMIDIGKKFCFFHILRFVSNLRLLSFPNYMSAKNQIGYQKTQTFYVYFKFGGSSLKMLIKVLGKNYANFQYFSFFTSFRFFFHFSRTLQSANNSAFFVTHLNFFQKLFGFMLASFCAEKSKNFKHFAKVKTFLYQIYTIFREEHIPLLTTVTPFTLEENATFPP
jgi:hypothetical protein